MASERDLRSLLEEWEGAMRLELPAGVEPVAEVRAAGTVLRPPADPTAVGEAEMRLGRSLPSWYLDFLAISDGAHASTLGIELDIHGRADRHGFWPVTQIGLARDIDPDHVALWADELNDGSASPHGPVGDEPVNVRNFGPLRDAVLITPPRESRCVLVPRDDDEEWEIWECFEDGATAHRSFADLLRHQIRLVQQRRSRRPTGAELERRVRAGEVEFLHLLARENRQAAKEVALELLEGGPVYEFLLARYAEQRLREELADRERVLRAAHVLVRSPDPRAIAPMREAFHRVRFSGAKINALATLVACKAPGAGELVADAARSDDDQLRRWATWQLEQDRDEN